MPSPLDALSDALPRTQRVLFEPFDAARYATLGFCFWLAGLGSASGNGPSGTMNSRGYGTPTSGGAPFDPEQARELVDGIGEILPLLAVGGAVVLVVAVVIAALLIFLQSRGTFLAIDGVVHERGAVREPWVRLAEPANALFRFRFLLSLGVAAAFFVLAGGGVAGVWSSWDGSTVGTNGWIAVALMGVAVLLLGLVVAVIEAVLDDLVVPVVYVRRCSIGEGFGAVWAAVRQAPGPFLLYGVLRFLIAIVVVLLSGVLVCFTCGLVLLPYVGTLFLLPFLVFTRSFSLSFVAQLAPDLEEALAFRPVTIAPTPG